jgi:hypothetical protein
MAGQQKDGAARWLAWVALAGGALLTVIGVRFFLTPGSAARTFGVAARPEGQELHTIIGLRNVWLGLLAVAFALLREWRAVALWFALGAIVCFADALVVTASTGRVPQIAFHVSCGIASIAIAALAWRAARAR